jgi:hypothetical protein
VEILLKNRDGIMSVVQDQTLTSERMHNEVIDCMTRSFSAVSLELEKISSSFDEQHTQVIERINDSASRATADQEERLSEVLQVYW